MNKSDLQLILERLAENFNLIEVSSYHIQVTANEQCLAVKLTGGYINPLQLVALIMREVVTQQVRGIDEHEHSLSTVERIIGNAQDRMLEVLFETQHFSKRKETVIYWPQIAFIE